jgi:hypothetical protein
MEFPNNFVMPTHLSTVSRYTNTQVRINGDPTNITWASGAGVGSLQWLVPLILPAPYLIASFFVAFGSSPGTGVFECGIFAPTGGGSGWVNKIMGTASTACVNTSSNLQIITPSGGSKLLPAGNYYMAYVSTGTNAIISKAVANDNAVDGITASGIVFGPTATSLSSGSYTEMPPFIWCVSSS